MADYNNRLDSPVVYGSASYFANNADFQPALSNHFEIYIEGLGSGAADAVFTGKDNFNDAYNAVSNIVSGSDAVGEILRLTVSSFSTPDISVDEIELRHGNDSVKIAGTPKVGDAKITVHDVVGADTERMLWAWFSLVYDPVTKMMGLAADYKKNGMLYQLAPDGSSVRAWQCKGLWPTSIPSKSFDYGDGREMSIDIDLKCDSMILVRKQGEESRPANEDLYTAMVTP